MGAGKTFDISVHKVKDKWSAKKLTFNNRPAYEAEAAAKTGIQKKGSYSEMVKHFCNIHTEKNH